MAIVEIYITMWCPFCHRAKQLLDRKGIEYREIDIGGDPIRKEEMLDRSEGRRTVPQIFIDNCGIGGSDELVELDRRGELDSILGKNLS